MNQPKRVLPIIIIAQFCCTSLWFAGNGVMADLVTNFNLEPYALGHLTAAVQFGFISGTLVYAILAFADRYSPSKVFLISAVLGACFNGGMILEINTLFSLFAFRFMTGFFLAGIYPIGMKIAADYYQKGLGKSLGFLVGALVLGTAFPHLLKGLAAMLSWKILLLSTSCLAIIGGLLLGFLVPDGPYRKASQQLNFTNPLRIFKNTKFRAAAFGYFGHMWELYSFWAFVPLMLLSYSNMHQGVSLNMSSLSFIIIGVGGIACVIGGYLSQTFGAKKIAFIALSLSGICCLVSPFMFMIDSVNLFILFLIFWGMVVIADSPLFSTLVAQNAPAEIKGTALTLVNCIGFSITIVSIQLVNNIQDLMSPNMLYVCLAIGPILGLLALSREKNSELKS